MPHLALNTNRVDTQRVPGRVWVSCHRRPPLDPVCPTALAGPGLALLLRALPQLEPVSSWPFPHLWTKVAALLLSDTRASGLSPWPQLKDTLAGSNPTAVVQEF